MTRLLNEPVLIGAAIRAVLLAVIAFGVNMTMEQFGAVMLAVEAVLALVTRALVTPNQLAEARVSAGGRPTVPMNVFALCCIGLLSASCATSGQRPPDVAVAQTGTAIVSAATELQNTVNQLTAAGTLPVAAGQKITDANKVVASKAAQLSTALKAYHAATSLADRSVKASEVQALITQLSGPLSEMLGVQLPAGAAQTVSRAIGNVMQVVGAIQAEIAKGLSGALLRPPLLHVA